MFNLTWAGAFSSNHYIFWYLSSSEAHSPEVPIQAAVFWAQSHHFVQEQLSPNNRPNPSKFRYFPRSRSSVTRMGHIDHFKCVSVASPSVVKQHHLCLMRIVHQMKTTSSTAVHLQYLSVLLAPQNCHQA